MTLTAMIRRMSKIAKRDFFEPYGEVPMMWLIESPEKGQCLIATPVVIPPGTHPGAQKEHMAQCMREFFADKRHAVRDGF